MRARRSIPLVLLLALAACGKKKEARPEPSPPPTPTREIGLRTLPAATRVIVGAQVARIAGSPLARRLVTEALARDIDARAKLEATLARCNLDLVRDVEAITIAMGDPADVALVARGRFDEKAVVECARAEIAGTGGSMRELLVGGRKLHGAESKDGAQTIWLTVDGTTIVLATTERWLRAVVDPASPTIDSVPETVALLGRVDQKLAMWGVGYLPAGVGTRLVELTTGAISAPAKTVVWEIDTQAAVAASLRLEMTSPDDATALAAFARGQLDLLAMAAQRFGLGRVVSKLDITSDGATVKVALALDEAELRQVEAVLAGQAGTDHKEQVR